MGKLTSQLSTWRKDNVECKKGNVTTLWFKDTQPNIMFIQNDSGTDLYVSIDHIPSKKDYTFKVKSHNNRLVARPYKTAQLYILNDGGTDVSCTVWSIFDTFRPEMLNDFSVDKIDIASATLDEMISNLRYDGVIRGFANGVKVPEVADIAASLENLLSGNTVDNIVNLYKIFNELQMIGTKVNSFYNEGVNVPKIDKLIPVNVVYNTPTSGTSVTFTPTNSANNRIKVGFISNDNLQKNLQVVCTKTGGSTQSLTLKPNEVVNEVWFLNVANIEIKFADSSAFNSDVRYSFEEYIV